MSQILFKILNQNWDGQPTRTMGGLSGIDYVFRWDEVLKCYVYPAKTQVEVDDLILVNRMPNFPWTFSFVLQDGGRSEQITTSDGKPERHATSSIPPYVDPKAYRRNYPLADLIELAKNCGFTPQGNLMDLNNVLYQIDAYMVGRAFAMEESKRLKAGLSQATEGDKITAEVISIPEAAPAPPPTKRKKAARIVSSAPEPALVL